MPNYEDRMAELQVLKRIGQDFKLGYDSEGVRSFQIR